VASINRIGNEGRSKFWGTLLCPNTLAKSWLRQENKKRFFPLISTFPKLRNSGKYCPSSGKEELKVIIRF